MAQYDEIIKHLLDRFAEEFARLAFKTINVEVIAKLDTELQTIKVHRNDMTFQVQLMKPPTGTDPESWLQRCIERTQAAPVDNQTRGTLFLALSTFGSLAYDPNVFQKYISEAMMQESPFYQLIIQRGIEQGAREVSIENILSALTIRFPHSDIEPVRPALETILSRDRLDELHRVAIQATNFEAFLQVLNA